MLIRFIAGVFAKLSYIFREECGAALHLINADASAYRAIERRKQADMLNGQADAMDARIRELDGKMEKGYWLCEDGHEDEMPSAKLPSDTPDVPAYFCKCGKPMRFVKRSELTGQELYESEKERKEAAQMAEGLRAQAQQQEETIKTHQEHERAFRQQAQRTREFADLLRKL